MFDEAQIAYQSITMTVSAQQRLIWIDVAKGVGITLVVLGHAGRGVTEAGLQDAHSILYTMDKVIYAFHMPLFFLLSGITFGMHPPKRLYPNVTKQILRLLFVLVIWTYAFLAMRALAGSMANADGSWREILRLPLPPFSHFWFLWALALNIFVFAVTRLILRSYISERAFWAVSLVIGFLAHHAFSGFPEVLAPWFSQATRYRIVLAAGGMIGTSGLVNFVPNRPVVILSLVFFAAGIWVSALTSLQLSPILSGLVLSCLLLPPVMAASAHFGSCLQALAFLGAISLAIYVMHTMFSAALRIAFLQVGVSDLALHLVFGTAVGLIGPAIFYLALRWFGMLRVAGFA